MKRVLLFCLIIVTAACSSDNTQLLDLRVNHFKATGIGLFPQTTLLVQADDLLNTNEWNRSYSPIEDFDYEWGFLYDLIVEQEEIENPPADASSIRQILKEVVRKEPIGSDVNFEIDLRWPLNKGADLFVMGDAQSGYFLINDIAIDCSDLCDDLEAALNTTDAGITGLFRHSSSQQIELVELILE